MRNPRTSPFAVVLAAASALAQQSPAPTVPPAGTPAVPVPPGGTVADAVSSAQAKVEQWFERFELSGFVAVRAFDTEAGGSRPDGAAGIQAATLFVEADVKDVGSVFVELRLDYFQEAGGNQVDIGEAHMILRDVAKLDAETSLHLKVGRFDTPFGEYYLYEDPDQNRLIGFPALLPYRWDEGVLGFADFGEWGFAAALTEGNFSRNSANGVGPAGTVRLHARPTDDVYVSGSALYVHESAQAMMCFGGSTITPVTGSATGTSPSEKVRTILGSLDLDWQITDRVHLQASVGGGTIDDDVDSFDRTLQWWMLEPTLQFAEAWDTTFRWSGAGTFDDDEGFQLEARPYGNGLATYGFDLSSIQRMQLGVRHFFADSLIGKVEVGFDRLVATDVSGRPNDTRMFTAIELVLSF
jgi:hypothetical protein